MPHFYLCKINVMLCTLNVLRSTSIWKKYSDFLQYTRVIIRMLQIGKSTAMSVGSCHRSCLSCFCRPTFFFFQKIQGKVQLLSFVRPRITSVSHVAMKSISKEAVCKRYYPLGFLGNVKHDLQILTWESCSLEEILNCWFKLLN